MVSQLFVELSIGGTWWTLLTHWSWLTSVFAFEKMFWRRNYFEETSSLLSPFSPYNYFVNTGFVHAFEDWGAKQIQVFYAAIAFSCETSCGNSCKKVFNFCLWEGLLWGQLQFTKSIFLSQQRSDVKSIEDLVQN